MLSSKIQDALNNQINAEFWSAYFYLSMSMHFEAQGNQGFANWFRIQYKEEQDHADILINYINARGGRVVLSKIDTVPTNWDTPLVAFEDTLAHERSMTNLINELYALAEAEHDYATRGKLDWFVSEQVEEEETVRQIIDRIKLIGNDGLALYMLDRELASRTYQAPSIQ